MVNDKPPKSTDLRQRAEALLKSKQRDINVRLSESDALRLIHELEVHQIELELQNQELVLSKKEADDAKNNLQSLYDFSPSGYYTLSRDGLILKLNFEGAKILGGNRSQFQNRSLVHFLSEETKSVFHEFLNLVFNTRLRQSCEVSMASDKELPIHVCLTGITTPEGHCLLNAVNISRRKEVEDALHISESRYRELVDAMRSGVAVYEVINDGKSGKDYIIKDFNKAALKIEGLTKQEVVGKSLCDLRPNVDDYGLIAIFRKVWITGDPAFYPAKLYIDNKYSNYYENRVYRLPSGEIVAIYDDVSQRETALLEIQKSKERYDLAMNATQDGIYDWNLESNEIVYTPAWKRMLGYAPDELPNDFSVWETLTAPDDVKRSWQMLNDLISKKSDRFVIEFKMKHKDGHFVDILSRANAVFDDTGKAIRLVGTHIDISGRKKMQEQLLNMQYYLSKAQEMGKIGTWELNIKENLLFWTKQSYIIFGIPEGTPMNLEKFFECIHPDDRAYVSSQWSEALNHQPYDIEHRLLINGEVTWVREKADIEFDNQGRPAMAIGFVQDITQGKENERELMMSKEKAEESDRLKSAFLANMSHEIRTPMNGILGFAELLKTPELSGDEQSKYIHIIQKSSQRMLNTITNIVEISKIEAGLMNVSVNNININQHLQRQYVSFRQDAEKKGITFILKNELADQEVNICTDSEKFDAILRNLIINAIKYTESGTIELGYVLKKKIKPIEVEFYIKDTGIGIDPTRQSAIFERFVQADIDDKVAYQGSGLGLSISKAYVEMLGGKIWVKSCPDGGSTFYFTLSDMHLGIAGACHKKTDLPLVKEKQINELNILIVEDDEDSELLIRLIVKKFGKKVLSVSNGNDALEACRENPDLDLIFMDIKLPGIDGLETTRQIREFNTDVIIIGQTAFASIGDRAEVLAAGCNNYLSKPLRKEGLMILIEKYFG